MNKNKYNIKNLLNNTDYSIKSILNNKYLAEEVFYMFSFIYYNLNIKTIKHEDFEELNYIINGVSNFEELERELIKYFKK